MPGGHGRRHVQRARGRGRREGVARGARVERGRVRRAAPPAHRRRPSARGHDGVRRREGGERAAGARLRAAAWPAHDGAAVLQRLRAPDGHPLELRGGPRSLARSHRCRRAARDLRRGLRIRRLRPRRRRRPGQPPRVRGRCSRRYRQRLHRRRDADAAPRRAPPPPHRQQRRHRAAAPAGRRAPGAALRRSAARGGAPRVPRADEPRGGSADAHRLAAWAARGGRSTSGGGAMTVEAGKKMSIPITKPALGEEEARAPFDSIKSGWVTQGPKVAEVEKAGAAYVGARHGLATTSCTTGLHLALASLGVGPGDEVIVPSFTFIASANAILYTGATVVFCEIDPRTYNADPADIEKRITKRTKAIMPVDQIGLPCDIGAINEVAKRHGVDVIEDAAPAIGGAYKGRKVGSNAHQTVFSFHPRKVITTGEGGMITTDDEALAEKARKLRAHAMSVSDLDRHKSDKPILEEYSELGFNYRMTDIQASIGLVQIRRLDELLRIRVAKADRYGRELADLKKVRIPYTPPYATHTYQSYCLDFDRSVDRDDLMARLLQRGVATR